MYGLLVPLAQIRAPSQSGAAAAPRTLSYNPAENAVLVSSDADGGSYQLYIVPKDGRADSGAVRCLQVNINHRVVIRSVFDGI
jgi:hypothetical protein